MNLLSKIRKVINPPYSAKDLLVIFGVLLTMLTIPLTVSLSLQRPSTAPRAATAATFTTSGSEDGFLNSDGCDVCPAARTTYYFGNQRVIVGEYWHNLSGTCYGYRRGYLSFDTSSLPDDATVERADLYLVALKNEAESGGSFKVNFFRSNWGPPPP